MSEFAGFDLDRNTERAWSRFRARLADHIAEMADDDVLVVSADSAVDEDGDGAAPYVQFCAWGETRVRSEVSSNLYFSDGLQLDAETSAKVIDLGWEAPTASQDDGGPGGGSTNFSVDLERGQADRLAVMTTQVLREVFAVPHPAFLAAGGLGEETPDQPEGLADPASPGSPGEADAEPAAVFPSDREHLMRLVDDALVPVFGQIPEHDEDDDIPVVSGTALMYVRVMEGTPVVQLFCTLVHDVKHRESAAFEVSVLNRDERFLKFVLVGDAVMTQLHLPAYPFAPEHLRAMLAVMSESVDRIDDDLVVRVGGRRAFEPELIELITEVEDGDDDEPAMDGSPSDETHPAMMTLLQLDADTPGALTPELAASVCSSDRALILALISWNSHQEIEWRQARDQCILAGETDEAAVCAHESAHAEAMVNLLRRTLRLVVEQQLGRERTSFWYAGTAGRTTSSRPLERDAALPGLDGPGEEPGLFDES